MGSRIVEYPERLKKTPQVSAWGREVIIRISPDRSLLMGEKVEIAMEQPKSFNDQLLVIKERLQNLFEGAGPLTTEYSPADTDNGQVTAASGSMLDRNAVEPSI